MIISTLERGMELQRRIKEFKRITEIIEQDRNMDKPRSFGIDSNVFLSIRAEYYETFKKLLAECEKEFEEL